jgi:hypothetical protein
MEKSKEIYLKRKAEQFNNILELVNPQIPKEQMNAQKIGSFHAICEDLLLLNLNTDPDITSAIQRFFDEDNKIVTKINTLISQMNILTDQRFNLCNNFYKGYTKIITTSENNLFNQKQDSDNPSEEKKQLIDINAEVDKTIEQNTQE